LLRKLTLMAVCIQVTITGTPTEVGIDCLTWHFTLGLGFRLRGTR